MRRDGKSIHNIQQALLDGFTSKQQLAMMVKIHLDENLDAIAGGNNLSEIVFALIGWAESTGKTDDLIRAAHAYNPNNPALVELLTREQSGQTFDEKASTPTSTRRPKSAKYVLAALVVAFLGTAGYISSEVQQARRFDTFMLQGIHFVEQGLHADAATSFQNAVDVRQAPEAYFRLAEAHRKLGNVEETISAYKAAIELDASNSSYYYELGNYLVTYPERHPEALSYLESAVHYDEENAKAYNELGFLYIEFERWSEARVVLEKGLGLDPAMATLYTNMGRVEVHEGNYEEAIRKFETSIRIDRRTHSGRAWVYLADAYRLIGERAKACETLDRMSDLFVPTAEAIELGQEIECSRT